MQGKCGEEFWKKNEIDWTMKVKMKKDVPGKAVQITPLTDWVTGGGGGGCIRNDSEEILFQSFLQGALVSSSGTGRDVHSLMLNIRHFLCQPQCRPPSKVPRRMVLERLLQHVTCLNHPSFHLLTVVRRGSCGATSELILFCTQSLVLCTK